MPVCKTCETEKSATEFHKSASCKGGIRSVCKQCVAIKVKAYKEANREKYLEQKREERLRNKDKYRERSAAYYESTKDRQRARRKAWYERNKDKVIANVKSWQEANPDKVKAAKQKNKLTRKDTVRAEYQRNKPDYFARAAARRVTVKQATPQWADKDQIAEMYLIAGKLNSFFTKAVVHVDHVVPLNNPLVCGLHVHTNLEILSAKRNLSKGNRHWPDMPKS